MHRSRISLLIAAFAAGAACSGCVNGRDCALVGCEQGVEIDFVHPYAEAGTYTIAVTVDRAPEVTCTVVVPPPDVAGRLCDHDGVGVRLGYADAAATTRAIVGVGIVRTDAATVTLRVAKDGRAIASGTFAPAYATSATSTGRDVNGSGCDPQSCTFAKKAFP